MKYKQENYMHMKKEIIKDKPNVEQTDMEIGMAWVMEGLRWKTIKDQQREQERNYKKKVKKEEKELG